MDALHLWKESLDQTLTFFPGAPPGVYSLHIHYSALIIVLNRRHAEFGKRDKSDVLTSEKARKACVDNALAITDLVKNYMVHHSSMNTMAGPVLYNITVAIMILIADVAAKHNGGPSETSTAVGILMDAIRQRAVNEVVARQVLQIVDTIMQVCHLNRGDRYNTAVPFKDSRFPEVNWEASSSPSADKMSPKHTYDDDPLSFVLDPSIFDTVFEFPLKNDLLNILSKEKFEGD
ncbi:hypothetical protein LTS17_006486 [Exophiala oligosperma]